MVRWRQCCGTRSAPSSSLPTIELLDHIVPDYVHVLAGGALKLAARNWPGNLSNSYGWVDGARQAEQRIRKHEQVISYLPSGPAGLPDSTGEGLWCPRALRERAWAAWRAKGLPSKGVEDYLYMDWKRLRV